ncbi:arsenate reductase ArsC [Aureimonas altamirensis]|uniref:arsenate reductase ArsC n=1 Tax=Aureimonas altamirensis TaxID=370622 RepID=UPI002036F47A|nr:arsenate reductase ArsC [Aureimonas altamirensis]MCM2505621.1 arsenate reductase ArsC [Aureimonas altamirensis]
MTAQPFNVLFLCTGNSARSILAESVLRKEGVGRFAAFSAGSHPNGQVNPLAIEVLRDEGYLTDGLRSKSWDEFAVPGAPKMDFVFTVCDQAAGESCPAWPGQPMTGHWGIEDPAAVAGSEMWRRAAFERALSYLRNRILAFTALPVESIERTSLTAKLREIGHLEGASSPRSDVA